MDQGGAIWLEQLQQRLIVRVVSPSEVSAFGACDASLPAPRLASLTIRPSSKPAADPGLGWTLLGLADARHPTKMEARTQAATHPKQMHWMRPAGAVHRLGAVNLALGALVAVVTETWER